MTNIELQKVCDWLNANKLTINAKKSNFVVFRPSQKKLSYQINIRIYNNASNSDTFLECKDYVKFLGVLIDKNLTLEVSYCLIHSYNTDAMLDQQLTAWFILIG